MSFFLALLGVFLIGLSKAGFATGLVNNLLKVPPYAATGLIDAGTLALSLRYAAAVPFGIAAGWWANRYLPQRHFDAVVAGLMIVTSLELLLGGMSAPGYHSHEGHPPSQETPLQMIREDLRCIASPSPSCWP